tara:strand:- start:1339 stop:2016 length:678 start_codon:yes stop_codon:yes gene_type:complete
MDFADLTDTPRKQSMLGGTIFFMLVFPIYFGIMPTLVADEMIESGSSGISASWSVSFIETDIVQSETQTLADGETYDSFFDLMSEEKIGIIIFEVSCMDNDEPGPGFTDTVDGQSDISQVEGMFEDQVNQGDCGMGGGFEMIWYPTNNYTGEDYTFDGTENDLRNIWDSNGNGLGTWAASITANIETNPVPVFGEVLDSDEDFQITWTAITYQLDITPIIDDVDT